MSTKSITTHSLVWTTARRLLTEGDEFAALAVSQFTVASIDDVRGVLHEMAHLGWLDYSYGTWGAEKQRRNYCEETQRRRGRDVLIRHQR